MANEIDLRRLQQVANLIFDHIVDDLGVRTVGLRDSADFYWEVPSSRLYAVRDDQPRLDVGRLSDDLDFLSNLGEESKNAPALLLVHLAPLLRYVGEEVGK